MCGGVGGACVRRRCALARPVAQIAAVPHAELRGIVLDEQGKPLAGAVASALGSTTAFAVSEPTAGSSSGVFPTGPIFFASICRATLRRASRLIQVNRDAVPVASIVLTRRADGEEPVPVLTAGVGPAEDADGRRRATARRTITARSPGGCGT